MQPTPHKHSRFSMIQLVLVLLTSMAAATALSFIFTR